jgi:hypothetical protein
MRGIYKIVEMGSCVMIYIPSFMKIGSGIQKLTGVMDKDTHRQEGYLMRLLQEISIKRAV